MKKFLRLIFPLLSVSIIFLFFHNSTALAASYTLSGNLSDGQGHYIGFAEIDIINPSTGTRVVGVTSNTITGNYSVFVSEGTYNISINPLQGAYQQKIITDVPIVADTLLNITLNPAPGSFAFSGKILTSDNQPVNNQLVNLGNASISANYMTGADGVFYLRVFPGNNYSFSIVSNRGTLDNPLNLPAGYSIHINPFTINQDINQDIVIPTQHVTVHITDPYGIAAQNVAVSDGNLPVSFFIAGIGQFTGTDSDNGGGGHSQLTNSNGDITLYLLPSGQINNNYIITAYPQSGIYFDNRLITNDEITNGLTLYISLSSTPTLYGRFLSGNTLLSNQTVELVQNNTVVKSLISDDQGNYYTKAPVGNYTFISHSNGKTVGDPSSYTITGDLSLTSSTQVSINLGGYTVGNINVLVRDSASPTTPVASHVVASGSPIPLSIGGLTNATGISSDEADTDSQGNARLYLFNTGSSTNGYTITATPYNSSYLPNGINNFLFNGGVETTLYVTSNLPPSINQIPNSTINEGDMYSASSSFTDVDSTSWTATVDYGDGTGVQALALSETNFTLNHVYKDEGNYTVTVNITDNQGATGTTTTTITVNNAPFTVGSITAPTNPTPVNTTITASSSFTDPGPIDTHIATWDWGDGTTSSGTVTESNGSGTVQDTHTYTQAGVYTVTLKITDDDGVSNSSQFQYIVIYDSSAGFLTIGGQYDSQSGWDIQNTQTTGKVILGISSKYTSGNTTPSGQAKINFQAGNINFISNSYNWLVVSGAKATLQGSGTINGSGNYTFLISGIDGNQTGGQNLIRVKITNSSNNVVYDSQNGAADTADPTTPLSNGVIKVH